MDGFQLKNSEFYKRYQAARNINDMLWVGDYLFKFVKGNGFEIY